MDQVPHRRRHRTNRLVGLEVTDESVGDSEEFNPWWSRLVRGSRGKLKEVLGDGAYDSMPNFNYLAENKIKSGIKTRVDASTQSRGSPNRAKCVRERRRLGYERWRDRHGYGMRWKSESFNSGVKRTFGEYVRATSVAGALQEAAMKFMFYNLLISA
jgi:IS5 family transposase